MHGPSNGMNTNYPEWAWRSLLLLWLTKCISQALAIAELLVRSIGLQVRFNHFSDA